MTTYREDRESHLEIELGMRVATETIGQNEPGDSNPYAPRPSDWVQGLIYFANPNATASRDWMRENGFGDCEPDCDLCAIENAIGGLDQ